jgi:multidrug efflux pump subunit AcrA (membrane-fusion protein)
VRLQLPGSGAHRGLLIQDRAVGADLDKRFVYLVSAERTILYRGVTLGPIVDGLRVVRTGLGPGDRIVVSGLQRVRPGMKVDPVAVAMEEPAAPKRDTREGGK